MLYTDDSHLASDQVDEQSTKEDWIIHPQKYYIRRPLNFWLYGKLLEEPAFILLMT
jgi:hypothetical protein